MPPIPSPRTTGESPSGKLPASHRQVPEVRLEKLSQKSGRIFWGAKGGEFQEPVDDSLEVYLPGFLWKDLVAMALLTAPVHFTSSDLRMMNLRSSAEGGEYVLNSKFWVAFQTQIS